MNLTADNIRDIIEFDGNSYFWKSRPEYMFANPRAAKMWNTRFAGKETLKSPSRDRYTVGIFGKEYGAHRVIWLYHYGAWPTKTIDHINGNAMDNRLCNLRDVSQAENCKNMPISSNNTSGVKGVHWDKQHRKWRAFINVNGKTKFLGIFPEKQKAVATRKIAEKNFGFHENHGRSM